MCLRFQCEDLVNLLANSFSVFLVLSWCDSTFLLPKRGAALWWHSASLVYVYQMIPVSTRFQVSNTNNIFHETLRRAISMSIFSTIAWTRYIQNKKNKKKHHSVNSYQFPGLENSFSNSISLPGISWSWELHKESKLTTIWSSEAEETLLSSK